MNNRTQVRATAMTPAIHEGAQDDASGLGIRRSALLARATSPAPLWEPIPSDGSRIPSTSDVLHADRKPQLGPIAEEQIIATLLRPLTAEETHQLGNDNRERELQAIFVELSPVEALALRRRLDADRNDDRIVVELRRLNVERRQRLKDFLRDPRRGARRSVKPVGY
jgi:hypothetical protein